MVNKREGLRRIFIVLWVLWAIFFSLIGFTIGLVEGHIFGGLAAVGIGFAVPPAIWAVGNWIYDGFFQ